MHLWKMKVNVTQLRPTLCNPMAYTVHGILQARILVWVAMPSSRGSSQPRDQTQVSHITGRFFICWATREARYVSIPFWYLLKKKKAEITDQLYCSKLVWKSAPHSSSSISKTYSFKKGIRKKTAIFDKTSKRVNDETT